jgi:tetratricopeptide (TPR) repeat protein
MEIYLDQALDLIQRAMAIKPGDPYITDSLGWVYFKKGAYDQAIAWLEKAAELSEFETIIASHLGDAYVKTGQYPKAVAVYKKALTNAKEDQEKETQEIKQKLEALDEQGHAVP